ncbi:MAG: M3 family oligoendopeptidase [Myxococcota bacterium]|nr:M3 family oligoendopeptidase [Myxococcota bacterium]
MNASPSWTLTDWFTDVASEQFQDEYRDCSAEFTALLSEVNDQPELVSATCELWVTSLIKFETACLNFGHLSAFVGCVRAADTDNDAIRAMTTALAQVSAARTAIQARLQSQLARASAHVFEALCASPRLSGCTFWLTDLRAKGHRTMAPELEKLAADLGVNGFDAWGQLYNDVTGHMEFEMPDQKPAPLAWRRSLMQDADKTIRHHAFKASNAALSEQRHILAASLNAIAGRRITLQKWRGSERVLDEALHASKMSQASLDAMLNVASARRSIPRRYLKLKAELMGASTIGFPDLEAPLELGPALRFNWDEAKDVVLRAFGAYHDDLRAFAATMFDGRHIEAEARPGKRAGAFCVSSARAKQSKVFMTYRDAMGDMRTLAHELGHAYHNHVMKDMRYTARLYPSTLAETASIFAEQLLGDALIDDPASTPLLKLHVLSARLQEACVYLLNIPMRFEFEEAFYERRESGPLSADQLCTLMHDTQCRVYGDVLDPELSDPWFWASKLHFFLTGISFYNYPYTFGYLFSLGVRAEAQRIGAEAFQPRLIELLGMTGQGTVEQVAADVLGVDLTDEAFWHASIDQVENNLAAFEHALHAYRASNRSNRPG